MRKLPYIDYNKDEMILRDFLALHRSQLANERTLLSYSRTSLAMAGGGIALAKLTEDILLQIIGWSFIPVGVAVGIIGIYRFLQVRSNFKDLDKPSSSRSE